MILHLQVGWTFSGFEKNQAERTPDSRSPGREIRAFQFHVLRTDRRTGAGLHSVVAEKSSYSMLIRIWFDVVAIKAAKST